MLNYSDVIECSNLLECSIKEVYDMIDNCVLKDVISTSETFLISDKEIIKLLKEKRRKAVEERLQNH